MIKLVTLQNLDSEALTKISDLQIVHPERDSLVRELNDADILIGNPGKQWQEILRTASRLRWVHVGSAGVEHLICSEFQNSKIVLTCAKGDIAGPLLAEHAFALLLGLTRGIASSVREGKWNRTAPTADRLVELGGKTMGLIGFGGVGRHLARMAQAFGMKVIAVRRSIPSDQPKDAAVWGTDRFAELLGLADVVVVSVPDTGATRGMFDAEAFRQMKETAYLITVGRGNTVDTDALVAALEGGRIAGAGLDVIDPEPLPDEHPLWRMPNVIITPHIAGEGSGRTSRNRALILENLKRFVNHQPLENIVNKDSGY